jgi:hypothetical protein
MRIRRVAKPVNGCYKSIDTGFADRSFLLDAANAKTGRSGLPHKTLTINHSSPNFVGLIDIR